MTRRHRFVGTVAPLFTALVTAALLAMPVDALADDAGWRGEYFPNPYLGGAPAVVRQDAAINFNWGTGSPDRSIPADNFSARWTRQVYFEAGHYRFTTETDDGVRLFVDGSLILDQWRIMAPTQHSMEISLGAGVHSVRMEYFEATERAVARLWWSRAEGLAGWRAEYFNNPWLTGTPALVRDDAAINFDWATGSPAPGLVSADRFSARWARTIDVTPGTYRFSATCDDGMRVWVDGTPIINEWYDHPATTHTTDVNLSGGDHALVVEYYENLDKAVAQVSWTPVPVTTAEWLGEYYDNRWLAGPAALVRRDAEIDFDWGSGAPDWRLGIDNFSVRWTRTLHFPGGHYEFKTVTDDGVRLYVDDRLIIDQWHSMARKQFKEGIELSAGLHTIRMEYFEESGGAMAKLSWKGPIRDVTVGNIVTCVPPYPSYSWIKVYKLEADGAWVDMDPHGYASIEPTGFLKIGGLPVDYARYGEAGHPYRVEQWIDGKLVRSVGGIDRGEPEFRVRAGQENYTPWQCPER
ncbi:MAG: PA14 domain-containing protein [Ardenticatenaceae bacterium]|nr:PA14 domain-containing protein [Ardenticatenaceae bacterium]